MPQREDATLTPGDRELVERIGRVYAPPAQTPARWAAFGEVLRTRLERRRRPALVPALAAAAIALLVWLALPGSRPSGEGPDALDTEAWEYELLVSSDVSAAADRDESLFLPDDYQAIGQAFLGS